MPYTGASERIEVRREIPIPGWNETKKLWGGVGLWHAVEVDNVDTDPSQDGVEQGVAVCGTEDVWLMRVVWPGGTRPDERCSKCDGLTRR